MTTKSGLESITADGVRALNKDLDRQLLAIEVSAPNLGIVPSLTEPDGATPWTAAQIFAHLGEFPLFFAGELRRWHTDPSATVGRTHEDPTRLAAVAAPSVGLRTLREAATAAFADLADALTLLVDDDITSMTNNVKYGNEPLSSFLERYVLGHKRGHLDQLSRTVADVESRRVDQESTD